jgi:hypothetical protein
MIALLRIEKGSSYTLVQKNADSNLLKAMSQRGMNQFIDIIVGSDASYMAITHYKYQSVD